MSKTPFLSRRSFVASTAAALSAPSILRAQETIHNISSFRRQDWRDHFETLGVATVVADTSSRALHFWNADDTDYRVFPTSVPRTDELTKRGYTQVVRKKIGPSWTPTPSQIERDPELKPIAAGPDNPLGTHAMYLDWPAYIIHGTHDTRKIGRRSSDGCIGLYNPSIEELFALCPVGTQVRLI
ncbi:L,D-transpeptidase [Silicimonas algicola]|uniref:L,D-transpeptidase-like protein n=1 Tax=Silicimonas algicola TaxID=1826607 RepID=A0A316GTW0_9RHOB|nr:L,D-transpeptidase [Silicimonas algicola]AZQ66177.1 L,D-transpeptidase [Silicimonas algicola]PWK58487.1 L,D-transpeptidase-like protein [Silicimonas algicola]